METRTRTQNRYDHRLKGLVRSTQDIRCALQQGVAPSTARGWLRAPATEVMTVDVVQLDAINLQNEVLQIRARLGKLNALLRVMIVVLKLSGYSLNQAIVPDQNRSDCCYVRLSDHDQRCHCVRCCKSYASHSPDIMPGIEKKNAEKR